MTQAKLIGVYANEEIFIKELNNFIKAFDYENLEIQYRTIMDKNHHYFSALVIVKDCR